MNRRLHAFLLASFFLGLALPPPAGAQDIENEEPPTSAVRVFLDCPGYLCDQDYLREQIPFVDYVRDRQVADVQVLVTTQGTGGGRAYTLEFIGRGDFEGVDNTLEYSVSQTATEDEERERLARVLKGGLVRYVSQRPQFENLRFAYEAPEGEATAEERQARDDPWDYWIFEVSLEGQIDGEQRSSSSSVEGELSANRTTRQWKLDFELDGEYSSERFEVSDSTTVTDIQRSYDLDALAVRSLSSHWSAGGRGEVSSSTFFNRDLLVRLAPAVEYNVFRYEEANRRQLRLLYDVGANYFNYRDTTIFNQTDETRFDQSLSVRLDLEQPWGSVSTLLKGSHYFFDFGKNRLQLFSFIDVQLFKGFSLNVSGNVALVQDQLYLSGEDLSDEEILLERQQLGTDYEYRLEIGFSYTFGSIYNNVVNPRFTG
jgi:hypothetical protein